MPGQKSWFHEVISTRDQPLEYTTYGPSYGSLIDQREHERWHVTDEFDSSFDNRSLIHQYDRLDLEATGRGAPNWRQFELGWKPQPQLVYVDGQSERKWNVSKQRWEQNKWYTVE